MSEQIFNPGDRIIVIGGPLTGRVGVFKKHCTSVFPEWCYITLDLSKRERIQKVKMILKSEIRHEDITN